MSGPVAVSTFALGPSPAYTRVMEETWVDENGARYDVGGVLWGQGKIRFQLQAPAVAAVRVTSESFTEAEWAERGIRTAEAWVRLRAAEAKAKADREEAARVQAEAQAAAFKAALADLTALVETVRWELRETRADLQAELQAAREDIAALRRKA